VVGKFTLLPTILFVYRNFLKIKLKLKNFKLSQLNYIIFIRKYVPSALIVIIITVVSTHNILAQGYNSDEYANRTLLSSLISRQEEGWSELIEESGPAIQAPKVSSYLEDQGNLQEVVIKTPFEEESGLETNPESGNLAIINPSDAEQLEESGQIRRSQPIEYVVQPGDVIGKIAEKFGISANTILWENDLTWSSLIKPGQKLTILPNSGINHEVSSGDTVLAIAKKYQTDAKEIIEVNKLADASDIAIGDLLFIPNGVKPTPVVTSYKPKVSVYSNETYEPAENIDTDTKLLWPLLSKRITQYYHLGHSGLDIGDKTGNPIYAAEAGKVERAGWSKGYGYNVIINHGNGLKTLYGHASKLLVEAGDSVSRGQTIALIGSTGWSTGPHLHLEVQINGAKQNPINYIK